MEVFFMLYKNQKKPKNPHERNCFDILNEDGWYVTKRGWPDFICFKKDEVIIVEVKPKRDHRLKRAQYKVMQALSRYGIKCYRWSPDVGFVSVTDAISHVK